MCLGTEELGLSVMGVQQAYETAALFLGMEVSVFSSPSKQAVETASQFGKIIAILDGLRERGILVRWWDRPRIRNYLRVSVGTDSDMDALCRALKELIDAV